MGITFTYISYGSTEREAINALCAKLTYELYCPGRQFKVTKSNIIFYQDTEHQIKITKLRDNPPIYKAYVYL